MCLSVCVGCLCTSDAFTVAKKQEVTARLEVLQRHENEAVYQEAFELLNRVCASEAAGK